MYFFIWYYLCGIKMICSYLITVTLYQPFYRFRKYEQICPVNFSAVATLSIWCDGPKPSQIKKKILHYVNTSYLRLPLGSAVAQSVERATPGEEVPGSIPAVAARSLLVGSVSV